MADVPGMGWSWFLIRVMQSGPHVILAFSICIRNIDQFERIVTFIGANRPRKHASACRTLRHCDWQHGLS